MRPPLVLVVQLGSTNDSEARVDAEVHARCALTTSLIRRHPAAVVVPSGDVGRSFNPTETPHWQLVAHAMRSAGVPAASIRTPGLPALHTVDEALMTRRLVDDELECEPQRPIELHVVTSDYHGRRVRHLFGVALGDPSLRLVELAVHEVPAAATDEELDRKRREHEVRAIETLKSEPFGTWLEFLQARGLEESNRRGVDLQPASF